MERRRKMKRIADHRIEFWLQIKSGSGWKDCGPDKTISAIFKNIDQLKHANQHGHWRGVVREIIDYEVRRRKGNKRKR